MNDDGFKAVLLRGGLGSLVLKVASTLLGLLVAVVLARALGPEGYGEYAYVFALISMLAIPTQVGLPIIVVRETARAQAAKRPGLMLGLWRWSSLIVAGLSVLIALLALAGVWLAGDRFTPAQLSTFYFGLVLVPLVALGNLRGAALRGLRHVVLGQLPESILRPGFMVLLLLTAYLLLGRSLDASVAMGLQVLSSALSFIIGAALLWWVRPEELWGGPAPEYQVRPWLQAVMPLALVSGIGLINSQVDILMLGWFHTAADVGIYRVAASSVGLIGFGMQAITSVIAPHIARLHAQGDLRRLQRLVSVSAKIMMLLALPVFLTFTIFGDTLLGWVFGKEFEAGYFALAILACGSLVNVAMGSVGALLNMSGHERDTARGATIAAAINVVLNLALIPPYGISGAAIATACSISVYNIYLSRVVRIRIGIRSSVF
ncbi:MAG: flippase [Halioglobus sp.]